MKLSEYISDFLVKNGITDVFTVTGGGAMHLNNAFGHQKGMRCLYQHHEQACAIAAESYARIHNRLPLVCVTTGPGGTNALTALVSLLNRMFDNGKLPVSDCRQRDVLRAIEKLFPFGETDGSSLGLKCSDKSGGLTCVFSKFTMTRDSAVGHFDIRFPTCTTLSEVDDKCREVFSENNFGFEITLGDEPHVVSEDSDLVRRLLEVYEENEGEKGYCVAIGGGTYVHDIEGGVAFGAERGDVDYHMHGDNEFITADELLKDAVLFAKVIEKLLT